MMSARPEAIQKDQPALVAEEDDYVYTLMVNLEINWEEALAHYRMHGRVCTNPECGKDIEPRPTQSRHCSVPCRSRAFWLRWKRGDTRLRPGYLEEN